MGTYIQVPLDSTGKKVDTSELTFSGNTVERQRIVIADPTVATGLAGVTTGGGLKIAPITGNAAPGNTLNFGQQPLSATPAQVIGANANRFRLVLVNTGGTPIYIGKDATVTTANGMPLAGSTGYPLTFHNYQGAVWAVVGAGLTTTVGYMEEAL